MLDHVSISVKDYEKSVEFYRQTLTLLGYEIIFTFDIPEKNIKGVGFGKENSPRPHFWISASGNENEEIGKARGVHFAFQAPNSQSIKYWYKKAIELGGKDNGAPGIRREYHPGYYGAFIIDPNGWRIEACCHNYVEDEKEEIILSSEIL